jgi:hypothetical protein
MIALLSPSKTQDFESALAFSTATQPRFKEQTLQLAHQLKGYSAGELSELMKISDSLAELNEGRFQAFQDSFTKKNARQALLAFKGDVYTDIQVNEYSADEFNYAQDHLRILSGLYGLLRPLDFIQPYRLEMKTPLNNSQGKDLYAFWGSQLTEQLQKDLRAQGDDIVVNLASKEYAKALKLKELDAEVVSPVFLDKKPGKDAKIIAIYAKKARGTMANYLIRHRISKKADITHFAEDGYSYQKNLSKDHEMVFLRTHSS